LFLSPEEKVYNFPPRKFIGTHVFLWLQPAPRNVVFVQIRTRAYALSMSSMIVKIEHEKW
jgi:hypothetical protein